MTPRGNVNFLNHSVASDTSKEYDSKIIFTIYHPQNLPVYHYIICLIHAQSWQVNENFLKITEENTQRTDLWLLEAAGRG